MTQTAIARKESQSAALAAVPETNKIANLSMRELKELGQLMVDSGAFADIRGAAQAMVKILAGQELGFTPIQSMTGVHFYNGKVEIGANLKASLIKESGKYDYEVIEHTPDACAVQFYRIYETSRVKLGVPVRYTIEDARTAGLVGKDNWKKYPMDMLFAACIRQGVRRHCADVLRGTGGETDSGAEFADEQTADELPGVVEGPVEAVSDLVVNGEVVDRETGEILGDAEPTLFSGPTGSAATPETTVGEILEWITSLARLKFGDDDGEFRKFLNGRNPAIMPREALIKLHGDLAAL